MHTLNYWYQYNNILYNQMTVSQFCIVTFSGSAIISESLSFRLDAEKAIRSKWWRCVHINDTCTFKSHVITPKYEFSFSAARMVTLNREMCYIHENMHIKQEKYIFAINRH